MSRAVPVLRCLDAAQSSAIDVELMSPAGGFSIDQLMELAGLSCAQAVQHFYERSTHARVAIVCGPGSQHEEEEEEEEQQVQE